MIWAMSPNLRIKLEINKIESVLGQKMKGFSAGGKEENL